MIFFESTNQFDKIFDELNDDEKLRIKEKLEYLKYHPNIFTVIKKLENFEPATHRLRIGNWRLLLKLEQKTDSNIRVILLKIGHRREIYQ